MIYNFDCKPKKKKTQPAKNEKGMCVYAFPTPTVQHTQASEPNEIHTQDSHNIELLNPKISAQMVNRGPRNRPRREGGKITF